MKKFLKVLLVLVVVYLAFVVVFWAGGVCPKYINLMPEVIIRGYPPNEKTLVKILYGLKLCPFSKPVY